MAKYVPRPKREIISKKVERTCPICGASFFTVPSNIKRGKGKYCSTKCQYKAAYKGIERQCGICKKTFITLQTVIAIGKGVFCSTECQYIHKTTKVLLKCQHCGKQYRKNKSNQHRSKFCSRSCQGAWKAKQNYGQTDIERAVAGMLKGMRYKFIEQFQVHRYLCDFLLCNHNLIIEADGDYWHSLPVNKARDKKKDSQLAKSGYKILRLTGEQILSNPDWCKAQIRSAVKVKSTLTQISMF